jgi:hypothetical protein
LFARDFGEFARSVGEHAALEGMKLA